jgi:hypothetical protein
MGLSSAEIEVIQIIATISGLMSIVGSLGLILSFLFIKELRTFQSKLVLYLSLADLGEAVAWVLSTQSHKPTVCLVQGAFEQFFGMAPILWQLCISAYLLQITAERPVNTKKQELFYHVICWACPAIATGCGWYFQIFGHSGAWCWIKPAYGMVGIGILYMPFLVTFTISACVYLYIARVLRKKVTALTKEELLASYKMRRQLTTRLYLIPFGAGWIFGLINRSYNLLHPGHPQFVLFILQAAFFPLQGFWNFWMYGMTERLFEPNGIDGIMYNNVCREFFKIFTRKEFAKRIQLLCGHYSFE